MPLRVVLVGAESAAIQVARKLAEGEHDVLAVLADEAPGPAVSSLAGVAATLGFDVLDTTRVREPAFAAWLAERGVDLLINVYSTLLVHPEVVRAPRIGSFNLHPGPLPEYAGLNVVSWAIYHGEPRHGVTLHWMEAGIDTGAIAYQASFGIGDDERGLSVFAKGVRAGVPLVLRLLETAARDPGAIPAEPQHGIRRVYRRRDIPQEGRLDWTRPARQIHDFVRACDFGVFPSPWGHPVARLEGLTMEITGTARTGLPCSEPPGVVGETWRDAPLVASGDEWLAVRRLVIEGRAAPARDILARGQRFEPA
jgi:methionyl-tRNA formyltransferase